MMGRVAASEVIGERPEWAGHVMKSAQRLQFCCGNSIGTFAGQDVHDD